MEVVKQMEGQLKMIWNRSVYAKTEAERGELLSKYHKLMRTLKIQREIIKGSAQ